MSVRDGDDRAVGYLLGELPPADRDAFEDAWFADGDAYERLLALEDDLIDRYCDGSLPPERRQRFEERYLATADGRERVEFARALKRYCAAQPAAPAVTTRRPSPLPRAWKPWAAVLAAALAGIAFLAGWQTATGGRAQEEERLRQQIANERERVRAQDRRVADIEHELARAREGARALEDLLGVGVGALHSTSLALSGGLRRGSGMLPRLTLEPEVALVRLRLQIHAQPDATYRASLQTPEGSELWTRDGLRPAPETGIGAVTFTVPAAVLATGQYVVTLASGQSARNGQTDAEFVFEVHRTR